MRNIKSSWLVGTNVFLQLNSHEVWHEKCPGLGCQKDHCSSSRRVTVGNLPHLFCSLVLNWENKLITLPYFKEVRISDDEELGPKWTIDLRSAYPTPEGSGNTAKEALERMPVDRERCSQKSSSGHGTATVSTNLLQLCSSAQRLHKIGPINISSPMGEGPEEPTLADYWQFTVGRGELSFSSTVQSPISGSCSSKSPLLTWAEEIPGKLSESRTKRDMKIEGQVGKKGFREWEGRKSGEWGMTNEQIRYLTL